MGNNTENGEVPGKLGVGEVKKRISLAVITILSACFLGCVYQSVTPMSDFPVINFTPGGSVDIPQRWSSPTPLPPTWAPGAEEAIRGLTINDVKAAVMKSICEAFARGAVIPGQLPYEIYPGVER
jgi:hypothetical protein